MITFLSRQEWLRADRQTLAQHQLERLNRLLAQVLPSNPFYQSKYGTRSLQLRSLEDLPQLPLLTKGEIDPGDGSLAKIHGLPADAYWRFHRTSGTHGHPLPVMDTPGDWEWWVETWQYVLDAGEVTPSDRALMAFSFGPFIGFWSASDALLRRGVMSIPGGGLSTSARLALLRQAAATIVCCTPTYALRLAETAREEGFDLPGSSVRLLIVAGEPGGSSPEVRTHIEQAWGARLLDHSGATEIGPWGFGSRDGRCLHIIESEFIAEFLVPGSDRKASPGDLAELVLTGLGRLGAPAIRYRTGDLVRAGESTDENCRFVWLEGGILGRVDEMLIIRGVNLFPSSVEAVVRSFSRLGEFRIVVTRRGQLDQVELVVEDPLGDCSDLRKLLEQRIGLRIDVTEVNVGSLPRFEGKARRLEDRRTDPSAGQ